MAQPQVQFQQNRGSLMPGQTISVNNYTVQVERYLSQGGFAHVYLVRTPAPVYGTTHHVLKRIAVPNESMLTEVKKEVDIMRLLKGHPNIVHLIDAAWHKLPNGQFEVFILMEYCPGGGIIDMMNRRLRERLTEAEILQIFVDVLEGVAYMHNSRPPLLHRDLKVENILQSSNTCFKLCDFGSATPVPPVPTTAAEIRALEADLNRHTTLQYRAPEMIDVYSKRPINEKSDVWALGVLLYKLCYYTTPFEEHGPLAIVNVQYRTPPYPVYSQEMNMLIASMLREHGVQRPSVFELLDHVHRLRGTKSKYSYALPVPPPLLPRGHQPINVPSSNPLNGVITYAQPRHTPPRPPPDAKPISLVSTTGPGIQARDKVLEAIAPLRRGRPTPKDSQSDSRPPSPPRSVDLPSTSAQTKPWSTANFGADQDKAWKAATDKVAAFALSKPPASIDDAWSVNGMSSVPPTDSSKKSPGFGDDFAEKLWSAPDANAVSPQQFPQKLSPKPSPNSTRVNAPAIRSMAYTGSNRTTDAFEGLGLMTTTSKPAPTLGEARKLRTGLAIMSSNVPEGDYKSNRPRPSPSPRPNYLAVTPLNPRSVSPKTSPAHSGSSSFKPSASPGPSSSTNVVDGLPPESRFPSLEELDARFKPAANALYPAAINDAPSRVPVPPIKPVESRSRFISETTPSVPDKTTKEQPSLPTRPSLLGSSANGLRSQPTPSSDKPPPPRETKSRFADELSSNNSGNKAYSKPDVIAPKPSAPAEEPLWKPTVIKRQQSTFSTAKPAESSSSSPGAQPTSTNLAAPALPPRPSTTTTYDWLTGDDDAREEEILKRLDLADEQAVLRSSPSKRASLIETSDYTIPSSATAQHGTAPAVASPAEPLSADLSPTVARFKRNFPVLDNIDVQEAQKVGSGLTDNWSPVVASKREPEVDSSDPDEGPEDAGRVVSSHRKPTRHKGRQSSVHDLVNQYGGGLTAKEKEKEREKNASSLDYSLTPKSLAPPSRPLSARNTPSPTSTTFASKTTPSSTPTRATPIRKPTTSEKPPIAEKPPGLGKSISTGKARPQSMFIFPSKTVEPPSSTLSPPVQPEEHKRPGRRTSISDMVQRYEAIGGIAKPSPSPTTAQAPPSPVSFHRPLPSKQTTSFEPLDTDRSSHKPSFSQAHKPFTSKASWSSDSSAKSTNAEPPTAVQETSSRPFVTTTNTTATYHRNNERTPTKPIRKTTVDVPPPQEQPTPRARRISQRVADSAIALANAAARGNPQHHHQDSISSSSTPRPGLGPNSSPRKPALSLNTASAPISIPVAASNSTSTSNDDTQPSSSPERPYQGVGKLIDQWQKKTAEAAAKQTPAAPGKRAGFPVKI